MRKMRSFKSSVKAKQKQAMPSKAVPTMTDFVKKQVATARAQQKKDSSKVLPKDTYATPPSPTIQKKQTSFVPGEENEIKLKQQAMAKKQSTQARMAKGGMTKKK
jgi:hypothetical protein